MIIIDTSSLQFPPLVVEKEYLAKISKFSTKLLFTEYILQMTGASSFMSPLKEHFQTIHATVLLWSHENIFLWECLKSFHISKNWILEDENW